MTKAIFFDIDGTILDKEHGIAEITPRVQSAMKNLQKQGNYIFIATGRPYSFLPENILNFGFNGFVMSNGAVIMLDGKIFFQSSLDTKKIKKLCDFAETENIEYMLESYPDIYCPRGFTACENFFKKIEVDYSKFIRDFDIEKISVSKMEFISSRTDLENVEIAYKKILAEPGVTGWADPFHFKTMEVYSDEVSKATGILKVLEHLNIEVKNSYAFGDGFNDREMLQTVGTSFVMATAKDEVKKFANIVVPSVHDDGVAVGIEKYIL